MARWNLTLQAAFTLIDVEVVVVVTFQHCLVTVHAQVEQMRAWMGRIYVDTVLSAQT